MTRKPDLEVVENQDEDVWVGQIQCLIKLPPWPDGYYVSSNGEAGKNYGCCKACGVEQGNPINLETGNLKHLPF